MEAREIMIAVGGWPGGWSHVHFIATLWSNLQVCKISSQAEIPKLDRVWQKLLLAPQGALANPLQNPKQQAGLEYL